MEDTKLMKQIKNLVERKENLYLKGDFTRHEVKELDQMKVELDRLWDLLRRRRALRNAGKDPDEARIRPAEVVENYEQ